MAWSTATRGSRRSSLNSLASSTFMYGSLTIEDLFGDLERLSYVPDAVSELKELVAVTRLQTTRSCVWR